MPTPYELDHIDERAAREILELLSCAVVKCQIEGVRVPIELRRKHSTAIRRYCEFIPKGHLLQIIADVEKNRHGRPKIGGRISCRVSYIPDSGEDCINDEDEDEEDDEEYE